MQAGGGAGQAASAQIAQTSQGSNSVKSAPVMKIDIGKYKK